MNSYWTKISRIIVIALCLMSGQYGSAESMAPVSINGLQLTTNQLRQLESNIGSAVLPGNYLVNAQGCWVNLSTGTSGCLGGNDIHSRYGSGSRDSAGNWNHWSDAAEGGVGGTANGCIYTTYGWSNC